MGKMYLQLLLTVGGFIGFLVSFGWLILTYFYATVILPERGKEVKVDWVLISGVVALGLLFLGCCIYGMIWAKKSKDAERELMERYRKLS